MYEYLKKLEEHNLLEEGLSTGVVSITDAGHKMIYEVFLNHKNSGFGTTQAVTNTSVETNTPESTVYRIIKKMKS